MCDKFVGFRVATTTVSLTLLVMTASILFKGAEGATPEKGRGVVSVLYAGSLVVVHEQALGPAFQQTTGYTYQGEGHGSVAAARMIKDRLRSPDIFISADHAVNAKELMGQQNRNLVEWYLTFTSSSLVIAYHPKSRFKNGFEQARAAKLPWYEVLARPGMKLGRTDPNLDPKGYRTLFLFELAERYYRKPGLTQALLGSPTNPVQIFPEPELLIRMESGQLDAGVFYRHEVIAHQLPFIDLPDEINQSNPRFAALYRKRTYTTDRGMTFVGAPVLFTITIPHTVRNLAGAIAFVRFALSEDARATYLKYGLRSAPILVGGDALKVPVDLRSFIQGRYAP
ncbi:MAG: substrate-binding domain-containing protein [candidate division NC10 bacterium]|nr:substrate-binding domain-containing protein [candidate division NC10 bacterium]